MKPCIEEGNKIAEPFTTEYIKLCQNGKIRKLRLGDNADDKDLLVRPMVSVELDEEIFKILEEWSKDEDIEYSFEVSFIGGEMSAYQLTISNRDGEHVEIDTNPLVVKIKTLIALLEGK